MAITPIPMPTVRAMAGTGPPGAGGAPPVPSLGKAAKSQDLGGPHSGVMSTLAGGEPLSRMMGHYKKGHSFNAAPVRGGGGGVKPNPRQGGLGPGKLSAPGSAADYSMSNPDTE